MQDDELEDELGGYDSHVRIWSRQQNGANERTLSGHQ